MECIGGEEYRSTGTLNGAVQSSHTSPMLCEPLEFVAGMLVRHEVLVDVYVSMGG